MGEVVPFRARAPVSASHRAMFDRLVMEARVEALVDLVLPASAIADMVKVGSRSPWLTKKQVRRLRSMA